MGLYSTIFRVAIPSEGGRVMECCQNASGLDLRLRFALFWSGRVRILGTVFWVMGSGPGLLWSPSFLAFELSFSRLPFVASHCFSRSIV